MKNLAIFIAFMNLIISMNAFAKKAIVLEVVTGDIPFAKLSNGEVRFLDSKMLLDEGDEVEINENGYTLENSSFEPTVLESKTNAENIFSTMRKKSRWRSQCYNRAHIWAFEEFKKNGTKLRKNFLFFTNRYIRNYRYKWWFHVAPATFVQVDNEKKEIVLDRTFFDEPVEVNDWTKHFIYSGSSCPTVYKYSDYDNNQNAEDCYLIKTSMYFWQPTDLEEFEKTGQEKSSFIEGEVRRAYYQAF